MTTYVFIPLSDELMFNSPEKIKGPLVAFNPESMLDVSRPEPVRPAHSETTPKSCARTQGRGGKNHEA